MQVEIWSDVVCPWCYIGKRRFEKALGQLDWKRDVEITWRSFELEPSTPLRHEGDMASRLASKYHISEDQARDTMSNITSLASEEGLDYHLETAKMTNSFDAHRLIKLAGLEGLGTEMKERLLSAYFTEGLDISDHSVLERLGTEVGMNGSEISSMYLSDYMASDVRNDESQAGQLGITGVPFFVFNQKYGISGAQSPDVFLEVLNKMKGELLLTQTRGAADEPAAGGDACSI